MIETAGIAAPQPAVRDLRPLTMSTSMGEVKRQPASTQTSDGGSVGLAAWLIDFPYSLDMVVRTIDGTPESLTRDDILDNCTLYWLTNTGVSASRLYRENTLNYFAPKGVNIPVAVSVFPNEIYQAPRSWAEKAYPKLIHFEKVAKGGHFAAWEQPTNFTEELRGGFRSLRA